MKSKPKNRNPMARDLRTPKYRPQVVPNKKKINPRKGKNRGKIDVSSNPCFI